jgi:tetratricopeptide (TPR) repeat protein
MAWSTSQPGLTAEGKVFGTPMYMAPEQVCGEEIGPATDVYALGLLCYEAVTGKPPVTGKSRIAILRRQLNDPVPYMEPGLQRHPLGKVIARACRKRPHKRYTNASKLLEALEKARTRCQPIPPDRTTARTVQDKKAQRSSSVTAVEKVQENIQSVEIDVDFGAMSNADEWPEDRDGVVGAATYGTPQLAPPRLLPQDSAEPPLREFEVAAAAGGATFDPGVFCRGNELGVLKRWVAKLCARTAAQRIVTCFGEAGAGKSRLLGTWRVWLNGKSGPEPKPICGMAVCRSNTANLLEPIREAFVDITNSAQAAGLTQAALFGFDTQGRLAQQFIEGLYSGELDDPEAQTSDSRLFAGLGRVLNAVAQQSPVILILDDVELASGPMLAFVGNLLTSIHASPAPVALLMTGSADTNSAVPGLAALLRRMVEMDDNIVLDVPLERLNRGRHDAFVERILPSSRQLKAHVFQLSQGNPLFVVQIIRYLHGTDLVVQEPTGWTVSPAVAANAEALSVPPDLLDLLTLRIDQAVDRHPDRPGLKVCLQWLALMGTQAPLSLLEHALAINHGTPAAERLRDELAVLSAEGLVRVIAGEEPAIMFDHRLVRESLLKEINQLRSAPRLHKAAADAMLTYFESRGDPPYLDIARHYLDAGEAQSYRTHLLSAASQARLHRERHRAKDICFELLRTLDDETDPDGVTRLDTWTILGELCESLGELGPAEDYYRLAAQAAAIRGLNLKECRGLRGRVRVMALQNRLEESKPLAEAALRLAVQEGDIVEEVHALIAYTGLTSRTGEHEACDVALIKLGDLLDAIENPQIVGKALLHLGEIAKLRGEADASFQYQKEALVRFEAVDDMQGIGDALTALGFHAVATGDNAKARSTLTRALEIKRAMGDQLGIGQVLNNLGLLAFKTADYDEAETLLRDSLDVFKAMGLVFRVATTLGNLGLVFTVRRRYPQADAYFDKALRILRGLGDRIAASNILINKGLLAVNRLKPGEARELFREARRVMIETGAVRGMSTVLINLAFVAGWDGEFQAAQRLLTSLLTRDEPLPQHEAAVACAMLAVIEIFLGDFDAAVANFDRLAIVEIGEERRIRAFVGACVEFVAFVAPVDAKLAGTLGPYQPDEMLASVEPRVFVRWLTDMAKHRDDRAITEASDKIAAIYDP